MDWLQSLLDRATWPQNTEKTAGQLTKHSAGAKLINDLGPSQAKLQLPETCETRAALEFRTLRREPHHGAAQQDSPAEGEGQIRFPLHLHLCSSRHGGADLQLQLLHMHWGSSGQALLFKPPSQGALSIAGRGAALLFLQLTFPEAARKLASPTALVGCLLVAGSMADGVLRQRLPQASKNARRRIAAAGAACSSRLGQHNLHLQEVRRKALNAAHWVEYQICHPAAALMLGGILWACMHPASFHVAKCLAAALDVQAGYAVTVRQTARGQLLEGSGKEEAWRRRHRWAARKLAHLQTDLYDQPPLGPLFSVLETVSIGVTAVLDAPSPASPGPASGPEGALALWGSLAAGGSAQHPPHSAASAGGGTPAQASDPVLSRPSVSGAATPAEGSLAAASPSRAPAGAEDGAAEGSNQVFVPSAYEQFETSRLPTVRTHSELEACSTAGAQQWADAGVPVSPFQALAHGLAAGEAAGSGAQPADSLVPFDSAELDQLEAARGDVDVEVHGATSKAHHGQSHLATQDLKDGSLLKARLAQGLDLFGRADHLQRTPAPVTSIQRMQMTMRALYLLMVFMPFVLLGPLLLLLGSLEPPKAKVPGTAVNGDTAHPSGAAQRVGTAVQEDEDKAPGQHGGGQPAAAAAAGPGSGPGVQQSLTLSKRARLMAWHLLLVGIRASGAAFIKWGQWSATREDMFPAEFCSVLAELHDKAPEHSWRASRREIEAVFGKSVDELFDSIEHRALASGSIAQVHKAVMRVNGKPRSVVVKVRHPKVAERLSQDFRLLIPLAAATSHVRSLKGLSLKSSLEQFSATMTAQTDLRVESAHLRRFFRNFIAVRSSVTPPFPLPGFETASVLIETFEAGHSVARYIANPAPCNTQIVALGVDAYLKMLLHDNFVHTDLHPGNILVRPRQGPRGAHQAGAPQQRQALQLVLLDFGLAEELNPTVRRHFISLLHMIGKGDGVRAAHHMLHMGRVQACPNPGAFTGAMVVLFRQIANIHAPRGIDLDQVMKAVLQLAREYEVTIDSSYAALVVGVCVIVGFATSLDPGLNLMDAATPAFLMHNLTGRIIGQLYA